MESNTPVVVIDTTPNVLEPALNTAPNNATPNNATPNNATPNKLEPKPTVEQVEQIVNTIKDVIGGKKITQGLIIRVVANCMTVSARMKIPGGVKKQVVTNALEQYIRNNSDLTQDEIDLMMAFVDTIVSEAIDVIADVANGNISFKRWFPCC
jgi:hypothetical protein